MSEIILTTLLSIITGVLSHLTFFPLINKFHNLRVKRLAQPIIGVLCNIPIFILWASLFKKDKENHYIVPYFVSYSLSFMWTGIGVIIGYIIDDLIAQN